VAIALTTVNVIGVREAALTSNFFAIGKLAPPIVRAGRVFQNIVIRSSRLTLAMSYFSSISAVSASRKTPTKALNF